MKILIFILFLYINTATTACDETVPKFISNIRTQVIFVGELHGTKEMPAFAGNLACHFAKKNIPVLLGLEITTDMQAELDAFYASNGNKQAKEKLLAHSFWYPSQDGRTSEAMFDLIELARKLRVDGYKVIPFAFDLAANQYPRSKHKGVLMIKGNEFSTRRDLTMATNIQTRATQFSNHKVIILAGNYHAGKAAGAVSAAAVLEKSIPNFSIKLSAQGGNGWMCTGKSQLDYKCGVDDISPQPLVDDEFDAVVPIEKVHASAPAVSKQPEESLRKRK
jgi:hypothetical protein